MINGYITEIEGSGLTHDAEVVCPGPEFPVASQELTEVLLTVPEEVLDPRLSLRKRQQRVHDSSPERAVITWHVRYIMKNNL